MILEKISGFSHFPVEVAFPFFYNVVVPFSKTKCRCESLLVTRITKTFCRDSPDSTSDNHVRNIHEIEADNVVFRLPTPTHSIRQRACRQFRIRVLVQPGLCDDRVRAPSTLATLKLFANVMSVRISIRLKE